MVCPASDQRAHRISSRHPKLGLALLQGRRCQSHIAYEEVLRPLRRLTIGAIKITYLVDSFGWVRPTLGQGSELGLANGQCSVQI
jgi:hypothetical protein